jgi:hypothetical protein
LLDISLYVSFENYRNRTRAAFTQILPWYANFVVPPQRRAEARQRTQQLGVSSLDVDDIHEDVIDKPTSLKSDHQQKKPFEHETEKHAKRLLGRRATLKSLLNRSDHAAAFRLSVLADNFFEPLQDTLNEQSTLLGTDEPAIVDCLAIGYLSLMLYPDMPQNWLASTLHQKYKPQKLSASTPSPAMHWVPLPHKQTFPGPLQTQPPQQNSSPILVETSSINSPYQKAPQASNIYLQSTLQPFYSNTFPPCWV